MKILVEKKNNSRFQFLFPKKQQSKKTSFLSENNAGKNAPQKLRQID